MPRTILLQGEPKSTQHIYRFSSRPFPKMYMTAEGKAIKEAYAWEAKSQWRDKPLTDDLHVHVTFYFGSRRKRDLDNQNKIILDALSGVVYEDDSQIAELHLVRGYDKENPRIRIVVQPTFAL